MDCESLHRNGNPDGHGHHAHLGNIDHLLFAQPFYGWEPIGALRLFQSLHARDGAELHVLFHWSCHLVSPRHNKCLYDFRSVDHGGSGLLWAVGVLELEIKNFV